MLYAQLSNSPRKWDAKKSLGFWDKNLSSILDQTTTAEDSQQKKKEKKTCWKVDFAVPDDDWVKLKKGEKRDKYPHLAR